MMHSLVSFFVMIWIRFMTVQALHVSIDRKGDKAPWA